MGGCPARPAVVFVEELEDERGFLGRFSARFAPRRRTIADRAEGLTIDDALAWGRARAGLVLVRFGWRSELWSAGATPHWSYPPWPPPDLPPLVPRAVPPPDWPRGGVELTWAVTIRLTPDRVLDDERDAWDIQVASAAAAAGLAWDRTLLDGFLADAGDGASGFSTWWSPAYRVHAVVPASDPAAAERAVAAGFEPPEGYRVEYRARPADLSEPAAEPRAT
jgi:hypothetical protein